MASTNSIQLTYAPEGKYGKSVELYAGGNSPFASNGTNAAGSSTIAIDGGGDSEVLAVGTVLEVAGHGGGYRVIGAAAARTASDATPGPIGEWAALPIEPPLRAALADNEVVTPIQRYQTLCYTGESLASGLDYVESDKVVVGGDVSELILVDSESTGTVDAEFGVGLYEDFMEAVMRSKLSAIVQPEDTAERFEVADWVIGAGATSELFLLSGADLSLSAVIDGLAVGDYLRLSGFASAGNNTIVKITGTPGASTEVEDTFGTMVAVGATAGSKIEAPRQMSNGTDQHSFAIEKSWTDITNTGQSFSLYNGQIVSQWDLSIPAQDRIRSTFTFTGKQEEIGAATVDATPTAAPSFETLLAATNVKGISIRSTSADPADIPIQIMVTEFNMSVTPQVELRKVAGTQGAFDYVGRITNVTGSMTLFLDDVLIHKEIYEAFVDDTKLTDLCVWFGETGATINEYLLEFPELKISTATKPAPGKGQSVFLNVDFQAYKDTGSYTLRVHRFTDPTS